MNQPKPSWKKWINAAALMVLLCGAFPARAEEYVKPSLENVFKTMIRFGAMNMAEDSVVDSYARIVACDTYKKYYNDEFQWKKVRTALRDYVRNEIGTYPTGYRYETIVYLGRYDFEKKYYPLAESSQRKGVNVFPFVTQSTDRCGTDPIRGLKEKYSFILDKPIDILGLPLNLEQGKALMARLEEAKNTERMLYVRFNIRIVFVAPLAPEDKGPKPLGLKVEQTTQVAQTRDTKALVLDARLDSAEYYEDENFTRLIYTYRP